MRERVAKWPRRATRRAAGILSGARGCPCPVLAEACHLLRRLPGGPETVLELLQRGVLRVAFPVAENARGLASLMRKCRDVPMSLADACLVRMAELAEDPAVITVGGGFRIYRIHGRRIVRILLPPEA